MSASLDDVQALHRKRMDSNLKYSCVSIPDQSTNVPEKERRIVSELLQKQTPD
jgi:hypothetical protein